MEAVLVPLSFIFGVCVGVSIACTIILKWMKDL